MNDITENAVIAREPVAQSQATSLLTAITSAAANKDVDIEKMERLFAMHQQIVARESEAAFNTALARAQANIEPVAAKAWNDQTTSYYAKLAAVNKMLMPIATREGLSISFDTADCPREGWFRTVAKVSHAAGHTREYHYDLPLDDSGIKGTANKTKVHAAGSTSSYARRYLVCMIFNISTGDDNDAQGSGQREGAMSESEFADFETAIEGAGDLPQWAAIWNKATARCDKLGDKEAHAKLKTKAEARRVELKAKK